LIREEADDTAFCILLEECRKDKNLSRVTYGRHFEAAVLDRILTADLSREGFTRVLRSVAAPAESIQGESLMVSSY
jgi:hypothetical protein